MTKTFFIILTCVLFCLSGQGQSCLPAGITFTSQSEVDNFSINYPGCKVIEGSVGINWNISNLNGLSNITAVGGILQINYNPGLGNLNGLENLTFVGQDLEIYGNSQLLDLNGLSNLVAIGGNLEIFDNLELADIGLNKLASVGGYIDITSTAIPELSGLDAITSVGQQIRIFSNRKMAEISGFNQLENIGGGLQLALNDSLRAITGFTKLAFIGENLDISFNPSMKSIQNLSKLRRVGGLGIHDNNGLTDLQGLNNLDTINGSFYLFSNGIFNLAGLDNLEYISQDFYMYSNSLDNLAGLGNLKHIGGDFQIYNNFALHELSGLPKLDFIGHSLDIYFNNYLSDLSGLGSLDKIGGNCIIRRNDSLKNITGLKHLDSIGGNLKIMENPVLSTLSGLDSLVSIGDSLFVFHNPALENLNAFESLRSVRNLIISDNIELSDWGSFSQFDSVPGSVEIVSTSLTDLQNLSDLRFVGGNLHIKDLPFITTLDGLSQLEHVGGDVQIISNNNLANLDGLSQLEHVGGDVQIISTYNLANLDGLSQLEHVGGDFVVWGNDGLTALPGLNKVQAIGGSLRVSQNHALLDLNGFAQIKSIGKDLLITSNGGLNSISGLNNLQTIGGILNISSNPELENFDGLPNVHSCGGLLILENKKMVAFKGLDNLREVGPIQVDIYKNSLSISKNDKLANLDGLKSLKTVGAGLQIYENPSLVSFSGSDSIQSISGLLLIADNNALVNLNGFGNLASLGDGLQIQFNYGLQTLSGFNKLAAISGFLSIGLNVGLTDIDGFNNLSTVGGEVYLSRNDALPNLDFLASLKTVGKSFSLVTNQSLTNLNGLANLSAVGEDLIIWNNGSFLSNLNGLEKLTSVGGLQIKSNDVLSNIGALKNLTSIGKTLAITDNPLLSDCAIFPVCNFLLNQADSVSILNNAPGCNGPAEIQISCDAIPVSVHVQGGFGPVPDVQVRLSSDFQHALRPTDAGGNTLFYYLDNGAFTLDLPHIEADKWQIDQELFSFQSSTGGDSVHALIQLTPKTNCPELRTTLGLPSFFRGCFVQSEVQVSTQNSGTGLAEGVKTAVVIPPGFEVLSTEPAASGANGDTLFFEPGELLPFEKSGLKLTVKTSCDAFLFNRTLCWEVFSSLDNACPGTLPAFSEIKLSAKCVGDTTVRFTLKNIGYAPTQSPHGYKIIRNAEVIQTGTFTLAAQQNTTVDVPADGATYRMEATKLDDGTLTATAIEACKGLTPGQITAFWLDKGPLEYDFDCRQVIGSFDPNQKTAVPAGSGSQHLLAANRPLQYTIDFQNTGTDTAFRVLLRDDLNENLDVSTFQPGLASHPCTWEIRGRRLEVLFFPIALPDSNVNGPASHGFFTFDIDQIPDLPDGTVFENTASIIFDFNPPIVTNTVWHTIGQLVVRADEPQRQPVLWQVLGNPTSGSAVFLAKKFIAGEKRFELYDAAGRLVRQESFSGQAFEFQRNTLPGGLYFFKIGTNDGRMFSGKIVLTE